MAAPWFDDYDERKPSYEKEFSRSKISTHNNSSSSRRLGDSGTKSRKADAASESRGGTWTKSKAEDVCHSGYARKTSDFTSTSEAVGASARRYRLSTLEMLSYGHKPWDEDYWEWKKAYEKAFAEHDRLESKVEDAPDSGYASKTKITGSGRRPTRGVVMRDD